MRSREWGFRIEDILEAISKIRRYVADLELEEFQADEKTVDAAVRNLGIIGEAARHIPQEIRERYPHIPWHKMWDLRNVVIHEYFGVDTLILWQTINEDLPPLVPLLQEILQREGIGTS